MAGSAILAIRIIADAKGAQKGMADAEKSTSKWASGIGKASKVAAIGLAGVGAVALSGVKAAVEDAQAQALLAKALENSAGASKAQVAATEDFITKTTLASGVADDELRPALANLVRGTKDVGAAQKEMALALDISAATGKDLSTVTAAMAKAHGGNVTALGKLVPGLSKATLKTKDMVKITAELQKTVGGTAAASAETAAGKFKRLQVAFAEAKESAGAALLPAMEKLSTVMLRIADVAAKHQTLFVAIAGALAAVAAAVVVVNAALKVYQATMIVIQAVQAATFLTNPVFLVVVAIIALVAAVVLLWKRSETFRNIVKGVWASFLAIVKNVWNWIKSNWPLLVGILFGPIGIAVALIIKNWDKVKGMFTRSIGIIKTLFGGLTAILTAPFNAVRGVIEKVIGLVEKLIGLIKKIKVPHISLPDLNPFSASAPTTAPSLAGVSRAPAARTSSSSAGGVVINVSGALDPEAVARQLQRILAGHNRRVGLAPAI